MSPKTAAYSTHEVPAGIQIRVSSVSIPLIEAHRTAHSHGAPLALSEAVIMHLATLKRPSGEILLATDSANLPKEIGWYRVDRSSDWTSLSYVPLIRESHVQRLVNQRRAFDLLHVNRSAAEAAKERVPRPVAVYVGYVLKGRKAIYVTGHSGYNSYPVLSAKS